MNMVSSPVESAFLEWRLPPWWARSWGFRVRGEWRLWFGVFLGCGFKDLHFCGHRSRAWGCSGVLYHAWGGWNRPQNCCGQRCISLLAVDDGLGLGSFSWATLDTAFSQGAAFRQEALLCLALRVNEQWLEQCETLCSLSKHRRLSQLSVWGIFNPQDLHFLKSAFCTISWTLCSFEAVEWGRHFWQFSTGWKEMVLLLTNLFQQWQRENWGRGALPLSLSHCKRQETRGGRGQSTLRYFWGSKTSSQ